MSNFNVKVTGTANVKQMQAQFAALEAQIESLNKAMAATVATANGVDPTGYARMARAVERNSATYRNAALSTRQFEVHQLRLNSATDEYVKKLQKQQISFRQWRKDAEVAKRAYREQLAMQDMVVRKGATTIGGRQMVDVVVPNEVHKSLDTFSNKVGWAREQLKSFSTQMVNWGKNTQWAGRQLMVGFTMPVIAFGAATGVMAYQIDKQMVRIQKVYDTTADANNQSLESQIAVHKELDQVRIDSMNTAINAAQKYGAAGTDTLSVQADLAATGLKGAELQKSTTEVMRIATLGEMDYQESLQATITLQSVFGQNNRELAESFNYMNAVENATSLQLKDFAAAIPIAAAPIKMMGGDIQTLGVLLTAMKERGIEATQGANAIKAAMQRLYRPSKQIQEEFSAITGASILDIRDRNKGNIVGMLQEIGDLTENLSKSERIQVFAGLFGTYQVTRISALVNGLQDMKEGVGQVSDAMRLAEQDPKNWADAADREIKRMAESASGRFKILLETLKLEMADMGEPFIEIGSAVIGVFVKIAKAFNSLPDGAKNVAAIAMVFTALIGPAIMLIGLFANLTGNVLKFFVSITKMLGSMEILDRDSRAAALAAELEAKGFSSAATQAEKLRIELGLLVKAQQAANAEARAMHYNSLLNGGMAPAQAAMAVYGGGLNTNQGATVGQINPKGAAAAAAAQQSASQKTARNWKAIGGSMAMAASSMAIIAMTSGGAVGHFAELVLYASLLGPAVFAMGNGLVGSIPHIKRAALIVKTNLVTALWVAKQSVVNMASTFASFASNVRKSNTPIKTMGAGLKSAGSSFVGMVGKSNIYLAIVAAIGYGVYKWWEYQKKIAQEQRDQEAALVSHKNLLAESLDIQIRKQKELNAITAAGLAPGEKTTSDLAKELTSTKEGKDLVAGYKAADDGDKNTIALSKYAQVLDAIGGDAQKATKYVEALFLAAGDGAWEAHNKAVALNADLGNMISTGEQADLWHRLVVQNFGGSEDEAKIQGEALGKAIADGMYRAVQESGGRTDVFNSAVESLSQSWDDAFNLIDGSAKDFYNELGITSGRELKGITDDYQKFKNGVMNANEFEIKWGRDPVKDFLELDQLSGHMMVDMGKNLATIKDTENAIVDEMTRQMGISEDLSTLEELRANKTFMTLTYTKAQAAAAWEQEKAILAGANGVMGMFGNNKKNTKETMLNALNQWRVAQGMQETGRLADGLGRATVDINGHVIDWESNQKAVNRALAEGVNLTERQKKILASINMEDMTGLLKDAMGSYQTGIADATKETFQNGMDAAIAGVEKRNEAAMDRLDRQQDNAKDAFDNRWEARTKAVEDHFDARQKALQKQIDAEEKADDIRQRLFDAEMARIDRLNQAANRNIDFNAALNSGNFDEAAKIRNDAEAAAAGWALEDAAAGDDAKSKDRVERLQDKIDKLGDIKDKRLDHLKDIEDAEREALERSQARKREALQDDLDATLAAEKKKWEVQKKNLDAALDHFLGYTATSDKDLQRHIKIWEKRYGQFNLTTEGQFNATSKNINDYLDQNLQDARREFANSKDWQVSGAQIANDLLQGAFGMTTKDFKTWLTTGVWPDGAEPPTVAEIIKKFNAKVPGGMSAADKNERQLDVHHGGGEIGSGGSGRKGYARTAPMSRNERMILAEKGEFMVNKKMSNKHSDVLNDINSGNYTDPMDAPKRNTGGVGMGFAGLMGALMAKAVFQSIATGVMTGATNAVNNQAAAAVAGANYMAGKAGDYGSVAFDATQLQNASTIASVGKSMGMSARDIEIGIMTAITESMLRNVRYGDRDSQGLFQQRPSQGWGTVEQVTNPTYAATKFFSALKSVGNRGNMDPWLAAQAVQRSAYSDGSNYRQYWDEAQAIFRGMKAGTNSSSAPGGYKAGVGGKHKPVNGGYITQGIHDSYTGYPSIDIGIPTGTPVYAVGNGTIGISKDYRGSDGRVSNGGYYSYGRYITLNLDGGGSVNYAHLSQRYATAGQRVTGGSIIGRSGNTGHSFGPHLHFGAAGGKSPYDFYPQLKVGGFTLSDGLAKLHKGEMVATAPMTDDIREGVKNFANGGNNTYNVNVNVTEPNASADDIANKVLAAIKRTERRKPQSRRG